jgi:hypothetical protein
MENQEMKMGTTPVQNERVPQNASDASNNIGRKLLAALFYIVGAILIGVCIYYLSNDLKPEYSWSGDYYFDPKEYVGGDAYNYIISATRSTALMVKSLIYAVLGSTSIIFARVTCK